MTYERYHRIHEHLFSEDHKPELSCHRCEKGLYKDNPDFGFVGDDYYEIVVTENGEIFDAVLCHHCLIASEWDEEEDEDV